MRIWHAIGSNYIVFSAGFIYGASFNANRTFDVNEIVYSSLYAIMGRIFLGVQSGLFTLALSYLTLDQNFAPVLPLLHGLMWLAHYDKQK